MKLIGNWKDLATKAWSMWGYYILGAIAAVPEIINLIAPEHDIPQRTYSIILLVAVTAGAVSRLIDQPTLSTFLKDESGAMRKRTASAIAGSAGALAIAAQEAADAAAAQARARAAALQQRVETVLTTTYGGCADAPIDPDLLDDLTGWDVPAPR